MKNCRLQSAVVFAAVLLLPAIEVAAQPVEPSQLINKLDTAPLNYYLDKADRQALEEQWLRYARFGLSSSLSRWENEVLLLMGDDFDLSSLKSDAQQQLNGIIEQRLAAWLSRSFFGKVSPPSLGRLDAEIENLNRHYLYRRDAEGNYIFDEDGNHVYKTTEGYADLMSGGSLVSKGEKSLWNEGAKAVIDQLLSDWTGEMATAHADLLSGVTEPELRQKVDRAYNKDFEAFRGAYRRQLNQLFYQEQSRFMQLRLYDQSSLEMLSGRQAADNVSNQLIAETQAELNAKLDVLKKGLDGQVVGVDPSGSIVNADEWQLSFRNLLEQGFLKWDKAEEALLMERVNWEQSAGKDIVEGEKAWARAFRSLRVERIEWMSRFRQTLEEGNKLWAEESHELETLVSNAVSEIDKSLSNSKASLQSRIDNLTGMLLQSVNMMRTARTSWEYWMDQADGGERDSFDASETGFDIWQLRRKTVEAAMPYLSSSLDRGIIMHSIDRLGAGGQGPRPGLWNINLDDAEKRDIFDSYAAWSSLHGNARTVRYNQFSAGIDEVFGRVRGILEGTHPGAAALPEAFYWCENIFGVYQNYAVESQERLGGTYGIVVFDNPSLRTAFDGQKLTGALLGDEVLEDDHAWENLYLDNWQVETLKARAYLQYWQKQKEIAQAVFDYASDESSTKESEDETTVKLQISKSNYDSLLSGYSDLIGQLNSLGADLEDKQASLKIIQTEIDEYQTQLSEARAEYQTLVTDLTADNPEYLAEQYRDFYLQLLAFYGMDPDSKDEGLGTAFEEYLLAAARYGLEEKISLVSEQAVKLLGGAENTDLSSPYFAPDQASFAELHRRMEVSSAAGFKNLDADGNEELFSLQNENGINDFQTYLQNRLFLQPSDPRFDKMLGLYSRYHDPDGPQPTEILWEMERIVRDIKSECSLQYEIRLAALRLHSSEDFHFFAGRYFPDVLINPDETAASLYDRITALPRKEGLDDLIPSVENDIAVYDDILMLYDSWRDSGSGDFTLYDWNRRVEGQLELTSEQACQKIWDSRADSLEASLGRVPTAAETAAELAHLKTSLYELRIFLIEAGASSSYKDKLEAVLLEGAGHLHANLRSYLNGGDSIGGLSYYLYNDDLSEKRRIYALSNLVEKSLGTSAALADVQYEKSWSALISRLENEGIFSEEGRVFRSPDAVWKDKSFESASEVSKWFFELDSWSASLDLPSFIKKQLAGALSELKKYSAVRAAQLWSNEIPVDLNNINQEIRTESENQISSAALLEHLKSSDDDVQKLWKIASSEFVPGEIRAEAEERFLATAGFDLARKAAGKIDFDESRLSWNNLLSEYLADFSLEAEEGIPDYKTLILDHGQGSYKLAKAVSTHEPSGLTGAAELEVYNASIWNSLDFDEAMSSLGGADPDPEMLVLLQNIDILLDGAELNGMPSDAELAWVYSGNAILREVDRLLTDGTPSLWASADFNIASEVMRRYFDEFEAAELKLRLETADPLSAAVSIWDEEFNSGGEGYAVLEAFAGLNLIHSSFIENGYYSPELGFNELYAQLCADGGFGEKETALLESIEIDPAAGLTDFFTALDSDNSDGHSGDGLYWNLMWRAAEDTKDGSYSLSGFRIARIFGGDPDAIVLKNWLGSCSYGLDACRAEYQAELDNQVRRLRTLASLPGGGIYEEILSCGLGSRLMNDAGLSAEKAAGTVNWFFTEYGLGSEINAEQMEELSTTSGEAQLGAVLAGRAAEFEHYLKKEIVSGAYSEAELSEILAAGGVLTRQQKAGLLEMRREREDLSVYNRLMHGDIGAFADEKYSEQDKILKQRGIYQRFLGIPSAQWDDAVFTPGYALKEASMSSVIDSLAFNRTRTTDSGGASPHLSPNDVFLSFAFEKLGGSFLEELSESLSLLHARRELYILSREYQTAEQSSGNYNWRSYLKSDYLASDDDEKELIPQVYAGIDSEDYLRNLSIDNDGDALESFTELRIFYGNASDDDNFILDASNTYLDSAAFLSAAMRSWTAPEDILSGVGRYGELADFIEDEPDEVFLQNLSSMQWGELSGEYLYEPDAAAAGELQEKLRNYDALIAGIKSLKANLGLLGRRREQLLRLSNGPGEAVAAALLPIKTRISDFEDRIDAARFEWQELIDGAGGYRSIEAEYSEIYEDAEAAAAKLEEAKHDYLRARAIFDYASAGYLSIDDETLAVFDPEPQVGDESGQTDNPAEDITEGGISNGTIVAADVDTGDRKTDEQKLRDRMLDIINKVSPKQRLAYAGEKLKRAEGAYNALQAIIHDNQDNLDIYGKDDVYRSYFNAYLVSFRESLALNKINTVLNKAIVRQESITGKALADWRKDLRDSYSGVSIRDENGSYELPGKLAGLVIRKSGDSWNISWGSGAQAASVPTETQAAAYFEADEASAAGQSFFEKDLGRWLGLVSELQKNDLGRGTLKRWACARKWEEYNSLSPAERKQLLSKYLNINNENDLDRGGAKSRLLSEWESAYNSAANAAAEDKWMYDFYKLLELSGSMQIDTVTGGGSSSENLSLLADQESIVMANEYMAKEFRKGAEALIASSIPIFAMAAVYFYMGAVALAAVPFGWIAAVVILAMASFLTAQASVILGNGTSRLSASHHIETEVIDKGNRSIGGFLHDFRNDTTGILQKKSVYDFENAKLLAMKGELDGGETLSDDERIEKLKTSVVDSFKAEGEDLRDLLIKAGLIEQTDGAGAVNQALGNLFGSYQGRMTDSAKDECGSSRKFIIALENEAQQKKQETARELNDYLTGKDGAARRQRKAEEEYQKAYHRYLREQIEIDEFKQAAEAAWTNPLFSVREHLLRLYEGQEKIAESIMGSDQFNAEISRELLESQKMLLSGTIGRKGIIDYRQQAGREVKLYELQMLQLEMAERRKHWENQMSAITARGQLEWTAGERKMNRKYEDWLDNTKRGLSKQKDGWRDKYLTFLSDKQAWLDAVSIQSIDYGNMEVLENFGDMTAGAIASAGAGIVMGEFDKSAVDPEDILNDVVDFELIGRLLDNAMSLNSAISGVTAVIFTRSGPDRFTTADSLQAIKDFQSGKNDEYEKHLAILEFNRLLEKVEYAEDNFVKQIESANRSMTGSLHGTMRDDGYILKGSRYERQLVTGSTLWDYIYEDGYVSAYNDFLPEKIDFSGELNLAADKVGNMDADALDALVDKAMDDIEDVTHSIFGDEDDISTYLLADMGLTGSRGADDGMSFERREVAAADGQRSPVEAVAAWLEEAAAEIASWFTAAGDGEAEPEELAKSVDPRYVDISPGLFGAHVGFAPAFSDAPDMTKTWSEEGQLKYEGHGEMGRIMGEFIFNKMKEGAGWGEVNMPHYKKKLWNDPDALSMEDVSGMITTVITAGAAGIGEWEAMALNLADDLAFTGADIEQGAMTWDEGLVSFGRKAAGAALNVLGADLIGDLEEGAGFLDSVLNTAARQSVNNLTGGLVNSLTYSSEEGFGCEAENLVNSLIGKGAMAGYLGSAAELGMGSILEGAMDAQTDAFYGSLKTIGSKMTGKAAEYAVYAGYQLAVDGFEDVGGSMTEAFDAMGLSVNVLDAGSLLGFGRLLAASGTDDYKDDFLGGLAQASGNLSGTGLFALNFSSSGISGRITTGGMGLGSSLYDLGKGFAADMSIRSYNEKNGNGALLRKGYAFGDRSAEDTVWRLLGGKDKLKFAGTDGAAMTVRNAGGGRNIYMDNRFYNAEGNDLLKAATVLQHESHRDGLIGAGNDSETYRAVKAHTEMARGLALAYSLDFIAGDENLAADVIKYMASRGDGSRLDETAFAEYVGNNYDSSGDYWKLMNDGVIIWDGERDLRNEAGEVIRIDKTGSFSQSLMNWFGEENAEKLLTERGINTEGMSEIGIAYQLMKTSGVKWDENAINPKTGKTGAYVPTNQEINIGSTLIGMDEMLSFQLSDDDAFHLGKISQESPDIAYYVGDQENSINAMAATGCFYMSTLGAVQTQAGELLTADQINRITELSLSNGWLAKDDQSIWPDGTIARENISRLAFAELGIPAMLDFTEPSIVDGMLGVGKTVNGNNHASEYGENREQLFDPYQGINYNNDNSFILIPYEHVNDYSNYYWRMYEQLYK